MGLSYCKGLSKRALSSIVSERRKRPFSSVADVYRRTVVERDVLENLIKAGFLDSLSICRADRPKLLDEAKMLPEKRKGDPQPEISLEHASFWWESREDRMTGYLPLAETRKERMEWKALALNVSYHPHSPYHTALEDLGVTPSEEVRELSHGSRVRAAGLFEVLQYPQPRADVPSGSS